MNDAHESSRKAPKDQRVISPRRLTIIATSLTLLLVLVRFGRDQEFAEGIYTQRLGPAISTSLTSITGPFPFSVAELTLAGAMLATIGGFVRSFLAWRRRERSVSNLAARAAARLLTAALVVTMLFYALWGIHYGARPLEQRVPWTTTSDVETARAELDTAARRFVEEANELADRLHRTSAESVAAIDSALEVSLPGVGVDLGFAPAFNRQRGRAKPVFVSSLMSRLGLAGFYFPWTGEANYNRDMPRWQIPHAVAHEKAHQRGVTDEGDANFVGFLACRFSTSTAARYSGALFAQRQLLGELIRHDADRVRELIAMRRPTVQEDVDEAYRFWTRREGRLTRVGRTVNDAYLRVNRVEGGIASYSRSARLILGWIRNRGGRSRRPPR